MQMCRHLQLLCHLLVVSKPCFPPRRSAHRFPLSALQARTDLMACISTFYACLREQLGADEVKSKLAGEGEGTKGGRGSLSGEN